MRSVLATTGVLLLIHVAGCGGGDDASDPDGGYVTGTFTAHWGPYTAQPGEEGTKCVEVSLGNSGPIRVHEMHNVLGPASHHFIVYRKSAGTPQPVPTDCAPFVGTLDPNNGAPLMITQRADETLTLPDGVVFTLQPEQLVRLELHYINTTDQPVEINVTSEFRAVLDATDEADFLFAGSPDIDLPAQNPPVSQTVGPVYLPFPHSIKGAKVFAITGHTHELGTGVTVATATSSSDPGTPIYDPASFNWDEPETTYLRPSLDIPQDGGFRFSCTYLNDSGHRVQFGESAGDEMCFFWLYYYPSKGARICFHTDQQGGHDVCCPVDPDDPDNGDDAVVCALIQNGF